MKYSRHILMAAFHCKERRVNGRQIAGGLWFWRHLSAVAPMTIAQTNTSQANASADPAAEAALSSRTLWAFPQGGFGVTEDRGGFKFVIGGGHAGRILTPNVGPGLLKGNFEYGVEVFPLWQSYTPKFQRQVHADLLAGRPLRNLCLLFSRVHGRRNIHRRQRDTGDLPVELHAR